MLHTHVVVSDAVDGSEFEVVEVAEALAGSDRFRCVVEFVEGLELGGELYAVSAVRARP
jgi:hypothetical protein